MGLRYSQAFTGGIGWIEAYPNILCTCTGAHTERVQTHRRLKLCLDTNY